MYHPAKLSTARQWSVQVAYNEMLFTENTLFLPPDSGTLMQTAGL